MKHAKKYFDAHQSVDMLYCTSDGITFPDMQTAKCHAAQLEDETIIPLARGEVMAAIEDMCGEGWGEMPEWDPILETE